MKRLLPLLVFAALAIGAVRLWDVVRPALEGDTPESPRRVRRFAREAEEARRADRGDAAARARSPEAGATLTFELIEPPAGWYGRPEWSEADRKYASLVKSLDVEYDPALGHAARELAHLYSVEDGLIPGEALEWLLLSAGAADWGVRQSFTATSAEGDAAIVERVKALVLSEPHDRRPIRVGVGEAWELGAVPPRTIAVLVSRSELRMRPLPRSARPGQTLTFSAELPPDATRPHVLIMGPDLEVRDLEVQAVGRRVEVPVEVGDEPGELWIELLATLSTGPTPLAQVLVTVGSAPPTQWTGRYPPDESHVETAEAAAELVYALIDADRARFGLPPLQRDRVLDQVARGHSADMERSGFFGHVSPTTGSVGDRLEDAGYKALGFAENVARNTSLWAAEVGLMRSLGHRKNILSTHNTHVGVAAVPSAEDGRRTWFVTQVFARPVVAVDVNAARERILDRIDQVREAAGLAPLQEDPRVQLVADAEARSARPDVHSALERADRAKLTSRGAYAWVHQVSEVDDVAVPPQAGAEGYHRVGVGVHLDMDAPAGSTLTVVVILAG